MSCIEPSGARFDHMIEFRRFLALIRIIVAEVSAAAFLALDGGQRDGFGNRQQVAQIERGMPAGIVFAIAVAPRRWLPFFKLREAYQRALHLFFAAHDADQILHHVLQLVLHFIRGDAAGAVERCERLTGDLIHLLRIDGAGAVRFRELRGILAGELAEHEKIGKRISTQPVGAVQAGRALRPPRKGRARLTSAYRHPRARRPSRSAWWGRFPSAPA